MHITHLRSVTAALGATLLGGALAACSGGAVSPGAGPTAQTVSTQAAPTVQAIATQAAPTVQALATTASAAVQNGAPTAQTLATTSAPTAQALATSSAPTVQAAATQVAPIAATASANAPVRILGAQSTASDSMITLQNSSASSVDLSGWELQVGSATAQLPTGMVVQPGQTVTLHTSSGSSTSTDVFLGGQATSLAAQLKPGARVILANPNGAPATAFTIPNA